MEEKGMAYYLEDLNRVRELSFERLGEWKKKYPYSQMVHFLMAKKYQLEGLTDDLGVFHRASFYSVDRDHLYQRMTNSECENEEIRTETEQSKPETSPEQILYDALKGENFDLESTGEEFENRTINATPDEPKKVMETSQETETIQLSPFSQWLGSLQPKSKVEQHEVIQIQTEQRNQIEEEAQENKEILDEPATTENKNESEEIIELPKRKKKKRKKKKKKKLKLAKQIERSVEMGDEIISEPLARILAEQGHSERAKEMYKKLSLIFPEKSSFFASQIEKINNT